MTANKIVFARSAKNYINTREPVSQRLLATLGVSDSGPVETGRDKYVFCRIGETEVAYVYNQRVPNTPGLKVWIGFSKDRPDLYQVLDVADTFDTPLSNPVGPHSNTHTWPEKDTVWIRGEQYLPGLVAPYSGQSVAVYSQPVWGASGWRIPSLEFVDLQQYNPTSGSVWALIEHNVSGSVSVRTSQWVQTKEMLEPWMIPAPSGTTCGAVALYGQQDIIASKRKSDIVDLRSNSPRGGSGGGGGGGLTNPVDVINFNTVYTSGGEPVGSMYWNKDEECIDIILTNGVTQQVGLELFVNVINQTGGTLLEGRGIGFAGSLGASGQLLAKYYLADGEPATYFIGVSTHDIPNGEMGKVTVFGKVRQINTTGSPFGETWADGDIIWASSAVAGNLSNTRPNGPAKGVQAAAVVKAHANGTLMVRPTFYFSLDELNDVDITAPQRGDIIQYVSGTWQNFPLFDTTKDPTGWINNQAIDVSYNKASGTITLTGDLRYYINGIQYQLTSPWTSPSHPSADGSYFLYALSGTNIQWSTSAWDFWALMVAKANKTTNYHFALREPHGLMPWQTHEEFHDTVSSYHESGGEPVVGTYAENTASDAATTPSFASAVMHDEDVKSSIPGWTQGTYTTMWIGVSGTARFDTTSSFPFKASGSYILVNNVSTGAETPATNNQYVNVYQVLVPVTADTDSQKYRMLMLQPQTTHSTLAAAQAEDPRGLSFGDITSSIPEFVVFTRITYVLAAGDTNTGKCRIATGGISYVLGSKLSQVSLNGAGGTAAVWGNIVGSLSDQTDLQTALDAKLSIVATNRTVLGTDASHPADAYSSYQVKANNADVAATFVVAGSDLDVAGSVFGAHGNGTLASPTATKNNARLVSLAGSGHDGSNWIGSRAAVRLVATEDWSGSAQGAGVEFWETVTGTSTMVKRTSVSDVLSSWISFPNSCTYISGTTHNTSGGVGSSNTTYSGVIELAGDWTGILFYGDKWSHVQGGTTRYYGIHKVELASGNTRLTLYGGTDFQVATTAITLPKYSRAASPLGFPLLKTKWQQTWTQTSEFSQAAPTLDQWYNIGSFQVPLGNWQIEMSGLLAAISNASQVAARVQGTLSTSSTTESDSKNSVFCGVSGAAGTIVSLACYGIVRPWTLSSHTVLYLHIRFTNTAATMASILTAYLKQPNLLVATPDWL